LKINILKIKTVKKIIILILLTLPVTLSMAQYNSADQLTAKYLAVKDALVAGSSPVAAAKAKELLDYLSAPQLNVQDNGGGKTWNKYLAQLEFDSRHISESTDIEHQREHFMSLSKNIYAVLKDLKQNTIVIYEQYCPMKKGYWLSATQKILNPYYSEGEMASCGITHETLNVK
jgi:hypothetical protein